jgi:DNA-binding transcriptional MocR family regulator
MSEELLYESLSRRLEELIRGGTFSPGDRIPSVRKISREHRVSISTVLEAYRRLEDSGLIEARPRSGYYVKAASLPVSHLPETSRYLRRPIQIGSGSLLEALMDTVSDPLVIPFASASPDDSLVPSSRLSSISNAIFRRLGGAALRYAPPPGRRELRAAISRRLIGIGLSASAEEIVTTQGATEAIWLALRATTNPGDLVAVETPTYFGILHLIRDLGLRAIEVPVHPREGLVLEALETALAKHRIAACVVQPNFQNPLGSLMQPDRKERLAALSNKHGFVIIEDDVYGDLGYDGIRHPSLARFGGQVIHCGSVSKTVAPGLRVGWIVPGSFYSEIKHLKSVHAPWNATLSELMVAEYLEAGGYDRHLRQIRRLYAVQSARMRQAVIEHFPACCRVNAPAGGFVLWLEMPSGFNAEDFTVTAMENGISLVPGPAFSPSGGLKTCLRLSCGFAFDERTLDAVATLGRLAKAKVQE